MPPLLHYIRIGRAEHRVCTLDALHERMEVCRPVFQEGFYRSQLPAEAQPADALQHYILDGSRRGLNPSPDFSAAYYQRLYPDVAAGALDPFYHYARWGLREERVGRPDFSAACARGGRAYDIRKPTVLLTSHEASRTGAPLLALKILEWLAPTHNVVMFLARGGGLAAEFAQHSVLTVTRAVTPLDAEYLLTELRRTHGVQAVLVNSVETSPMGPAAFHNGLPCVALVHEFASYTLPRGRMSELAETATCVVTPATLIRDSLGDELQDLRNGPGNHIIVRPQGCLPSLPPGDPDTDLTEADIRAFLGAIPGKTRVVLGAGYVQIRKGLDLFAQTAAEFRAAAGDDVRFLWIGSNYYPTSDATYGVFVADMSRRLKLEQTLFFLPNQGSLDAAFAVADVFFLPSRLDPFPNVVLDALRAGKPVVCFDRATGVAEHMRDQPGQGRSGAARAVGAAVPYCNVQAAAQALLKFCKPAEQSRAAGNTAFVARQFSFDTYMADLLRMLAQSRAGQDALDKAVDAVEASGLFDVAFHDGTPPTDAGAVRRAMRLYVARAQKGLCYASPRPGFHEGVAQARAGRSPALLPSLDGAPPAPTHRCVTLPSGLPPFIGQLGLHLHLHYAELAEAIAKDLEAAGCDADLVVTTTSGRSRIEAEYAFRAHRGAVRVLAVANRGRDIGPFLGEAGRLLREGGYDIVGHLHGKRSAEIDSTMGERWRTYLMSNLLGLGAGGVRAALAPFGADPALGLLFAEDRHCVGWNSNKPIAEALAERMLPRPTLPTVPVFPLGTMFWARPAALAPLWNLGIKTDDLPPEPLPYDGTALHAVERMLPAICEAAGMGWCTIFKPGSGW